MALAGRGYFIVGGMFAALAVQLVALYSEVKPLEPSLGVEGVDGEPMHTWHAQP